MNTVLERLNSPDTVIVIGRGHGGTRLIAKTLRESGVFMGSLLNASEDLIPVELHYECCRKYGKQVEYCNGLQWNWPVPVVTESIRNLLEKYLEGFENVSGAVGWKLPENTLIYPLLVMMFPEARFIWWVRDPRDSIAVFHWTDDLQYFGVPSPLGSNRALSYFYQHRIIEDTPRPERFHFMRFEDFVLHQDQAILDLGEFLHRTGTPAPRPIAKVQVHQERAYRYSNEPIKPEYLRQDVRTLGYA